MPLFCLKEYSMTESNFISNNPFGINLQIPHKTIKEVQKVIKQDLGDISVNPFLDYLDKNDKVFSGEVAKEINNYYAQIYALGQVMREGETQSKFDIKM